MVFRRGDESYPSGMKTYVISLERQRARRTRIERLLNGRSMPHEMVDAIDAADYSSDQIDNLVAPPMREWRRYLRPGAVCCALSHQKAYAAMLHARWPAALILEDDATPRSSGQDLERLMQQFMETDFDILLLSSYAPGARARVGEFRESEIPGHTVLTLGRPPLAGAISYFIRARAAQAILSFNDPVRCGADDFGGFAGELGLQIGVVKPDLFIPAGGPSTIDYLSPRMRRLQRLIPEGILALRRKVRDVRARRNYEIVPAVNTSSAMEHAAVVQP